MHRKHTANVQSQNATKLQWSPKSCQTWREIGFTCQPLVCNPIPWCKFTPSQLTWGNNWQGNPISVVKTFATSTKNCALFAEERTAILKQSRSNPQLLVNSNNEIYSACKHRPHSHGNVQQTTSSLMSQSMTETGDWLPWASSAVCVHK